MLNHHMTPRECFFVFRHMITGTCWVITQQLALWGNYHGSCQGEGRVNGVVCFDAWDGCWWCHHYLYSTASWLYLPNHPIPSLPIPSTQPPIARVHKQGLGTESDIYRKNKDWYLKLKIDTNITPFHCLCFPFFFIPGESEGCVWRDQGILCRASRPIDGAAKEQARWVYIHIALVTPPCWYILFYPSPLSWELWSNITFNVCSYKVSWLILHFLFGICFSDCWLLVIATNLVPSSGRCCKKKKL